MGKFKSKEEEILHNLEEATSRFDPYLTSLREARPKVDENSRHFLIDSRRKRLKKGYRLFKEWFGLRSIWYAFPAGGIGWLFKLNPLWGWMGLSLCLGIALFMTLWFLLGELTLEAMSNEKNEEFFHFRAYANRRREYDLFAPFLLPGNHFKFGQITGMMKQWKNEIKQKDDLLLELEKELKRLSHQAAQLPIEAEQEMSFQRDISDKLMEKIQRVADNALTFSSMDFAGRYAIHELVGDHLELKSVINNRTSLPKYFHIEDSQYQRRSIIKILDSEFNWEAGENEEISFINDYAGRVMIYTLILDHTTVHSLNPRTESGKMNIQRVSDAITTTFHLLRLAEDNKERIDWNESGHHSKGTQKTRS